MGILLLTGLSALIATDSLNFEELSDPIEIDPIMDNVVLSEHVKGVSGWITFSPDIRGDNLRQGVHPWCCSTENNLETSKGVYNLYNQSFRVFLTRGVQNPGVKHQEFVVMKLTTADDFVWYNRNTPNKNVCKTYTKSNI